MCVRVIAHQLLSSISGRFCGSFFFPFENTVVRRAGFGGFGAAKAAVFKCLVGERASWGFS